MKNTNIPLAIILKRTQNGYTFESLQELHSNKDKNKKPKLGRKPAQKGVANRLIKQIGLSNEQMAPQIVPIPEPQPIQYFEEEPHDNLQIFQQIHEEEEISCEIDRETDLPKTPAIWFDKLQIHQIQRKDLKEFFNGSQSKTPELYMKYRNIIVEFYQKNPKRILRGDVNTIMRIHEFLQKHGIINFCLNYDGNYTFKATSLSKSHEQRVKPQTVLKSLPDQDEETAVKEIDTDNMTITIINKNFSRTYRACCFDCKLISGIVWFVNVVDEESAGQKSLCFACWNQRSETQKKQYTKIDVVNKMEAHSREGKNFPKNAWNIDENIKLLDFMSNGQKNWKKLLEEFAGKRTIEDIILQFLQFPISNFEFKESKKQLENDLKNESIHLEKIGFEHLDYKQILKDFYENSVYSNKRSTIYQNGHRNNAEGKVKKEYILETEEDQDQQIKEMFSLTTEQIVTKIQGIKERQQLIQEKMNHFEPLNFYKFNDVKPNSEDEFLIKSSAEVENKSKSVKNYQEKKNDDSQLADYNDADINEV